MLTYLLFAMGFGLLLFGGDWLVKGSVGLAENLGISPLIIGLTIVALGTSAPELVISLQAALSGSGGLAIGNVIGSNIANVFLVLGVPALIATLAASDDDLKPTLFLLTGLTAAFMVQLTWGPLSRIDGLALLLVLVGFLTQQFYAARHQTKKEAAADEQDYRDEVGSVPHSGKTIGLLITAGLIALPVGASLTVDAAIEIATRWHVPEEVIGLTIVAIGTSLPELATGVMAARHGNSSVAIGNVIGSNLFNIAAIMGLTAAISGNIPVSAHITSFDMWIMLLATLVLAVLTLKNVAINRTAGALLIVAYLVYLLATSVL